MTNSCFNFPQIFIAGQNFKDHCANQHAWIFWISILSTYKLKTSKSNWSQVSAEDNEQWRPRRLRPCSNGAHWCMVPPSAGHGEVMGNPTPVMDTDNTIMVAISVSIHPHQVQTISTWVFSNTRWAQSVGWSCNMNYEGVFTLQYVLWQARDMAEWWVHIVGVDSRVSGVEESENNGGI